MENLYMPINDLVYAPVNAIKNADVLLCDGILNQIANVSDEKLIPSQPPTMKLKNIRFLYEKVKSDEYGDTQVTAGLTVPTASIIPLSALQISRSSVKFNIEVKTDKKDSKILINGKPAAPKFRKTDHLPKMCFQIETEAVTLPEGISRLMDILDINQVPDVDHRVYIDPDGKPYDDQESFWERNKASREMTKYQKMYERLNTALSSLDKQLQDMNGEDTPEKYELLKRRAQLHQDLDKYESLTRDKEFQLLEAEMKVLEATINDGK